MLFNDSLLLESFAASISRFGRGDATTESEKTLCILEEEDTKPCKGKSFIDWLKETAKDQPDVGEFLAKASLFGVFMFYFWLCDFQHIW